MIFDHKKAIRPAFSLQVVSVLKKRGGLEAKKCLQSVIYSAESHECHGQQTSGDQRDTHALHPFRYGHKVELLAYAGKYNQCQSEAQRSAQGIPYPHHQVEFLLYNQDGHTKHSTVSGYQRKEYSQCLIKCRGYFFQDDFHQLHQ